MKDSFCISTNIESCYTNKTENLYEFFLIQDRNNIISQYQDGFIGFAPGENGFKSYPEYLVDKKIISRNSVNVAGNDKVTKVDISLGLDKPFNVTGVNYIPQTVTYAKQTMTAYLSSFQGFGYNSTRF